MGGRPAKSRHSPFFSFLCPSASPWNLYHSHFYSFLYVQGTVLSLHSPLIISGGPLNPQCLAHKGALCVSRKAGPRPVLQCPLWGVTASLAFLVFSFLCVVFFFGNIMGIVCKTHLHCKSVLWFSPRPFTSRSPVSPTSWVHGWILPDVSFQKHSCLSPSSLCALPAKWGRILTSIMGTFSWRFLMGMDIHPGIDKIGRTWYWGAHPKKWVLGSHCPQYSEGHVVPEFSALRSCLCSSLALVASGPTWYCTDLCKCRAWKALHRPFSYVSEKQHLAMIGTHARHCLKCITWKELFIFQQPYEGKNLSLFQRWENKLMKYFSYRPQGMFSTAGMVMKFLSCRPGFGHKQLGSRICTQII